MQTEITDEVIITRHSYGARARARVELQIVNAIIARAAELGYTLRVFDGAEEYGRPGSYDVKTAVFDLDRCCVVADKYGNDVGFIVLQRGSLGWDLVIDYGPVGTEDGQPMTPMEDFIFPINKLACEQPAAELAVTEDEILVTLRTAAAEGHWMIRSDEALQRHELISGAAELTIAREHSEDPSSRSRGWSWRLVVLDTDGRTIYSDSSSLDSIAELQSLIRNEADR